QPVAQAQAEPPKDQPQVIRVPGDTVVQRDPLQLVPKLPGAQADQYRIVRPPLTLLKKSSGPQVLVAPGGKTEAIHVGDKISLYDIATGKLMWETTAPPGQ